MNTKGNTQQVKDRFILSSVMEVESLPFSDGLKDATRKMFQKIWDTTPHKIGVGHLQRVLGIEFRYLGGPVATYAKAEMKLPIRRFVMVDIVAAGQFHVVTEPGFTYVPVAWVLTIEDGNLTFTPELQSTPLVGRIPFGEFMRIIDPGFYPRQDEFEDNIVVINDHPDLDYGFFDEVDEIMEERIRTLAEDEGLDHIIIPIGMKAVDKDDVAITQHELKSLLAVAGYRPGFFKLDEGLILKIASKALEVKEA